MADVLSQSEIDALLNSMLSGGKDQEKVEEKKPEQKYRKYDFSSPKKFTKDRIKMLNGIFDTYARIVNSRLNARLRANCEITVESIEEQRYYEFSNALGEGDVLGLINVETRTKKEEVPVMFYLSTYTGLTIIEYLLGGDGSKETEVPTDYSYTDLELKLYEDTVSDMVSVMKDSWESYLPIEFTYGHTEVNPTLNHAIGLDEIIVIVDLKIQFPNGDGRMSICLPSEMLINIFAEISRENPMRRSATENKSTEIFENLRDSELEIIAQLGSTQLSLSDVYHLHVGDVINLGQAHTDPIYLEIGGYHWFTGKMGTYKKNMAVRIEEGCYQIE